MKTNCIQCGKFGEVVKHHTNYFPEMIIAVCKSCHQKIHGNEESQLSKLAKEFYKKSGQGVELKDDVHSWLMGLRATTGRKVKVIVDEILREKMLVDEKQKSTGGVD